MNFEVDANEIQGTPLKEGAEMNSAEARVMAEVSGVVDVYLKNGGSMERLVEMLEELEANQCFSQELPEAE